MLRTTVKDQDITITLPRVWSAQDAKEYSKLESLMESSEFKKLFLDLSNVSVLNVATIWLIDSIQWKCVSLGISFNILGTSKIVESYFNMLATSMR